MKNILNFVGDHPIISIIILSMVIDGAVQVATVLKD